MKKKIENVSAFLECTYRNSISKIGFLLMIVAIAIFIDNHYFDTTIHNKATILHTLIKFGICLVEIFFFGLGILLFYFTGFGKNSFQMYQRAYEHMVEYKRNVKGETTCARAGCDTARRRFKKNFPNEYKTMMKKPEMPNFSIIIIRL
jgi:hypothetical protein